MSHQRRLDDVERRLDLLEGERLVEVPVARLTVGPDDVILVRVANDTEPELMDDLARIVRNHLGTHRVLMVTHETTFETATLPRAWFEEMAAGVLSADTPEPVDNRCLECGGGGCDDCGGSGVRS